MNVSLSPELEAIVHRKVERKGYASADEVVREALRLLDERDSTRESHGREIREKIAAGVAALRGGESHDGEAVFDRLEAELDAIERRESA